MADDSIATRRHPQIEQKLKIWGLIADSYAGGDVYIRADHLIKYPKESTVGHVARKQRAVYFNHVQPLADMLAGFLYAKEPLRKYPPRLKYLEDSASKHKSLNAFMQTVAIHSLLRTCGVLVDSPMDADQYLTEADRKAAKKNPYCILYMPESIRDFHCDEDGNLEWILLDNSYTDASKPNEPAAFKRQYRLWTKTEFVDYSIQKNEDTTDLEATEIGRKTHGLNLVPFVFFNWRDVDEDYITETPFEDIALLDRQIFNCLSYLDEMLAAGTFKMLFFPVGGKEDVPEAQIESGVGGSAFLTFPKDASSPPFFSGHTLEDVGPFISAMQMYLSEIFAKVGLDKDQEKLYVQSGVAKSMEFEKCEAMLRLGAQQMEQGERKIFEFADKWENGSGDGIQITYERKFQSDLIEAKLARLQTLAMLPYEKLKKSVHKQMVREGLSDIPDKERDEILKEIEETKKPEVPNMIQIEKQAGASNAATT